MNNDIITGSMIKLTSEVILCTGENNPNIYLIDPKTSGILETYSADAKIAKNGLIVSERFGNIVAHQNEKTILLYFSMLSKKPFIRASLPEKLISSCFSPDEYYFYGGSQSGLVYVWDCVSGHLLHKFQAHHKSTSKILATSDGGTIITAGEDYTINTWNIEQIFCRQSQWNLELNSIGLGDHARVKPQTSLVGHTHFITDIKITQKKHGILASTSIDKTCRIWNYSKGVQLMMISLESPINCLALDPLEDFVFLGCKNHNVYSYRISQDKDIYNLAIRDKVTQDPKLQLGKNLEKKTFVGHKEEVTAIAYYQEENMIITGGSNGKILFWSFDGNMVKQMNILTTSVNNIHVFKRPYEFDKNESFLKQKKRPFDIAIFKKYEEEKPSTDPLLVPIIPNGEEIIQKKRRIDLVKEQAVSIQYIKATFPMFSGKGRGGDKATVQENEGKEQVDLKTLQEENEKLLKMNEKLFSMCFLKDKI